MVWAMTPRSPVIVAQWSGKSGVCRASSPSSNPSRVRGFVQKLSISNWFIRGHFYPGLEREDPELKNLRHLNTSNRRNRWIILFLLLINLIFQEFLCHFFYWNSDIPETEAKSPQLFELADRYKLNARDSRKWWSRYQLKMVPHIDFTGLSN